MDEPVDELVGPPADEQDALEERLRERRVASLEAWMAEIRATQAAARWHVVPPDQEIAAIEMGDRSAIKPWTRANRLLLYVVDMAAKEPRPFVEKGWLGSPARVQAAMNRLTPTIVVGHMRSSIVPFGAPARFPRHEWDMGSISRFQVGPLLQEMRQVQPIPDPNFMACDWPAREAPYPGQPVRGLYPTAHDPYFDLNLALYGPPSKTRSFEYDALHSARYWMVPRADKVDAHFSTTHPRPGVELEVECLHRKDDYRYTYAARNKFTRIADVDPREYEAGVYGFPNEHDSGEFTAVNYYKFRRIKRFRVTPGFTQDSEDPIARNDRTAIPDYPGTGDSPNAPAWVVVKMFDVLREGVSLFPEGKHVRIAVFDNDLWPVDWLREWESQVDPYGRTCSGHWKALAGLIKMKAPLRRWNVESNEFHYAPGGHGAALASANWQSSTNEERRDKKRAEWDRLTPEQRRVAEARQLRDAWEERTRGDEPASPPPWLSRRDRSRSFYERRDYGEESEEEGELREPPRDVRMCVGRDGLPNVSALKL